MRKNERPSLRRNCLLFVIVTIEIDVAILFFSFNALFVEKTSTDTSFYFPTKQKISLL